MTNKEKVLLELKQLLWKPMAVHLLEFGCDANQAQWTLLPLLNNYF